MTNKKPLKLTGIQVFENGININSLLYGLDMFDSSKQSLPVWNWR